MVTAVLLTILFCTLFYAWLGYRLYMTFWRGFLADPVSVVKGSMIGAGQNQDVKNTIALAYKLAAAEAEKHVQCESCSHSHS